jgi:hypothetical protein
MTYLHPHTYPPPFSPACLLSMGCLAPEIIVVYRDSRPAWFALRYLAVLYKLINEEKSEMPPEHVKEGYNDVQRCAVLVSGAPNNCFRPLKGIGQ